MSDAEFVGKLTSKYMELKDDVRQAYLYILQLSRGKEVETMIENPTVKEICNLYKELWVSTTMTPPDIE